MTFWDALPPAEKINLIIAVGTIIAALAAALSAVLAARAVRDAAQQMNVHLEEIRAQTFLSILAYEREVQFTKHMEVIRTLGGKPAAKLTDEEQTSILVVVNFLNHLAHLIRYRYVVPKQLLLLYSPSIATCRNNLLGKDKWLDEVRRKSGDGRYYLHFEKLCQQETADLIWKDRSDDIIWTGDPYKPILPRGTRTI